MGALPNNALPAKAANLEGGKGTVRDRLPDYLPARMVNEFGWASTGRGEWSNVCVRHDAVARRRRR